MAKRRKPVLRFFHKKPMENPNDAIDLNEIAETPQSEQVDIPSAPVETPIVPSEAPSAVAESDASQQTADESPEGATVKTETVDGVCSPCKGDGLIDQNTICAACSGTGRVA